MKTAGGWSITRAPLLKVISTSPSVTGGVGGFYLAASLGYAKQFTGSYAVGFVLFAALALAAWAGIAGVRLRWRRDAAALAGVRV